MTDERMSQEDYDKLCAEIPNVGLVRPFGIDQEWHKDYWRKMGVTVLICQRKTLDAIRITLESLLRFYPDIPILVVDGDSEDESLLYLQWMEVKHENIKVWERKGKRHSHGETLHEALMEHITTKYALIMDSDLNIERGGWVEGMMDQFKDNPKLYATGNRMIVSRENEAIGPPHHIDDVLLYAHIVTSIYHVPTYKTLKRFYDHGACAYANMIDAEKKGFEIGYYPVDKYISHASGQSWTSPRTQWKHDFDCPLRPFITFIVTLPEQFELLKKQTDHDFDIVTPGNLVQGQFVIHKDGGGDIYDVSNWVYDLRFKVQGEYVCYLNEYIIDFTPDLVNQIKIAAITGKAPDEMVVGGIEVIERKFWQQHRSML